MNIFFDQYKRFIERIGIQYPEPTSTAFRERKFDKVKWSKPEHRNFFTIIKILAERGPSTINEIVESDGLSQQFKPKNSRYITYRRIIVGDKKTNVTGLIEKGAVTPSKAEDKLHKKYELSHNGILYAIKLFMDLEIVYSGNYKNMLEMDSNVKWYDYSKQKEFPTTIMDIVAKNYSHRLPLIFGKWDYLKNNPRVNVYNLYDLTIIKPDSKMLLSDSISGNTKYSITFNTFDGDITLGFYTRQIESAYYSIQHFVKAIDDEDIKDFLDKMFYSYERLHRQNYYFSQAHYFLYKGQKEKAVKYMIKGVESNDMLSKQEKEKFKKKSLDRLDYLGITLCK
ncbi:hypothetical protein NZNM25_07700 [Nitrosopumilus zosterae]|uniref:Uncharacterized protein n=1 Tax=Nitrosopumilus zosterae TaxID=718286 RepID=A0A2S2KQP8_9ARCH|nr:hypothetical protein [Nitrosopumilus zosterae]BDQ30589.1 hypothetical protein NZOSNM25_000695 [Nitrosopumilus zosterae]GBH33979.1 hypothetical protein NZNM25_07700 [Nitrosopumilus zosterae]